MTRRSDAPATGFQAAHFSTPPAPPALAFRFRSHSHSGCPAPLPPRRRFRRRRRLQKAPGLPTGTYPSHSVSLFNSSHICIRRQVRQAVPPEFPTAAPPRGSSLVPPHTPPWRAPILPRRGSVRPPDAFSVRQPWLHADFRCRGYSGCGNTRHNSCRATDIFQFHCRPIHL